MNIKIHNKRDLFLVDFDVEKSLTGYHYHSFFEKIPDPFYYHNDTNKLELKHRTINTPVFYMHHQFHDNYEHWFCDYIYNLKWFLKIKKDIPSLKILTYPVWHDYQTEFFKLFFSVDNLNDIMLFLEKGKTVKVKNMYYITDRAKDISPLFSTGTEEAAEIVLDEILSMKHDKSKYDEKIYITRRPYLENHWHERRLTNENDVWNLLKNEGYMEVNPQDLNYVDEVLTFYYAKKIIAPVGAAICNFFFCRNKQKILCINSPVYNKDKDCMNLSKRLGYKYKSYNKTKLEKIQGAVPINVHNYPFKINDIKDFENVVDRLGM